MNLKHSKTHTTSLLCLYIFIHINISSSCQATNLRGGPRPGTYIGTARGTPVGHHSLDYRGQAQHDAQEKQRDLAAQEINLARNVGQRFRLLGRAAKLIRIGMVVSSYLPLLELA